MTWHPRWWLAVFVPVAGVAFVAMVILICIKYGMLGAFCLALVAFGLAGIALQILKDPSRW